MSVGKPGNGAVVTSTACGRRGPVIVTSFASARISQPVSSSFWIAAAMSPGSQDSSVILPPVIAAAARNVCASMRSGMIVVSIGSSSRTPSITRRRVPSPEIRAPQRLSTSPSTVMSGSRATLSSTVRPVARTAAIMSCAVAPTETTSKLKLAPLSRTSRPTM